MPPPYTSTSPSASPSPLPHPPLVTAFGVRGVPAAPHVPRPSDENMRSPLSFWTIAMTKAVSEGTLALYRRQAPHAHKAKPDPPCRGPRSRTIKAAPTKLHYESISITCGCMNALPYALQPVSKADFLFYFTRVTSRDVMRMHMTQHVHVHVEYGVSLHKVSFLSAFMLDVEFAKRQKFGQIQGARLKYPTVWTHLVSLTSDSSARTAHL